MTIYQKLIAEHCPSDVDPRHIEAWMRDEYGTLDQVSVADFQRAVQRAIVMCRTDPELSARLAESMGTRQKETTS